MCRTSETGGKPDECAPKGGSDVIETVGDTMARKMNIEARDDLYFGGLFATMALETLERPKPAFGRKPKSRKARLTVEVEALSTTTAFSSPTLGTPSVGAKPSAIIATDGQPGFTTRQFDLLSLAMSTPVVVCRDIEIVASPLTVQTEAPQAPVHQTDALDKNRPYTDDDDKMIARMLAEGTSLYDIADVLGRSRSSIQHRKAILKAGEVKPKAASVRGASYLGLGQMVSDREMATLYAGARYPQRSIPAGRLIVSSMSYGSSTPLVASQIGELVAANTKPKAKTQRRKVDDIAIAA